MRWLVCAITLGSIGTLPAYATEPDLRVLDPLIDSIFVALAKRQGFNVLAAPEDGAAQIGNIYYVTEPRCASDLTAMAKTGAPIRPFLAWELPKSQLPIIAPRTTWTVIRLDEVIGGSALADLYARVPEYALEIDAALSAFNATNAEIYFGTRETSSIRIKQIMDSELRTQGITSADDLGTDATGAIAPHAELIVQNFAFNRVAAKGQKGRVAVRLMEWFGAGLAAKQDVSKKYGFRQATYSTAAFKPVTSLFRACDTPARISNPPKRSE